MGLDDLSKILEKTKAVNKALKEAEETMAELEADPRHTLAAATKDAKALAKEVKAANKELDHANKNSREVKEELEKASEAARDFGSGFDEVQTGLGQVGSMLKAPPKDLRSAAKGAHNWAEKMKGIASAAEASKIQLGNAAKMATKLGGVVGGISKVLLGWPGLIIMGAKAILDSAVQIDSYIKNLNKRYAAIRGPNIMTSDVNKQFKDFNLAIVDIAANLRDGLESKQVYDFMSSITEAGAQLNSLNQGFYGYRDAVHIAAKASKNLGVDVVTVGSMMGDMMLNLRMNLDDINKAFVEVAFDAEKSGMSTDRFWNSVKNATASLAFYGKFIKEISNTTKVFTQSQIGGADQAASTAEEITQAFQKSSTQTNMAFIALARNGGAQIKKLFKGVQEQAEKEVKGIQQTLTLKEAKSVKNDDDVKAIKDLKLKLINAQRKTERLAQAAHNGDIAMGQELAMVTSESPGLIMDMIKGIKGINFSTQQTGEGLEAIEKAVEGASKGAIGKDAVRYFVELAHQGAAQIKMAAKELKFSKKDAANQKEFVANMGDLTDLQSKTPEELNGMAKTMSDLYGISEEDAKKMLWSASTNDKTLDATKKLLSVGYDTEVNGADALKTFDKMVDSQDAGATITKKSLKETAADNKETQQAYDDTFKKIRDNTLSIDDMKTIAADGLKYNVANLARLTDISVGVSKLVGHFMSDRIKEDLQKQGLAASEEIAGSFPEIAKELHNNNPAVVINRLDSVNKGIQKQLEKTSAMNEAISGLSSASEVTDKIASLEKNKAKDPTKFAESGNEELLRALILISTDIQNSTKDLGTDKGAYDVLEGIRKSLEKKAEKKNLSQAEKDQLAAVKKQTDELIKKGFIKSTDKAKEINNKILEEGKQELAKNDKIISNLTMMSASASETAKLLEVSTLSDPEKMKTLLGLMGGDTGEITGQALSKYGSYIQGAVMKLGKETGAIGAVRNITGIKKDDKVNTNKIIAALRKDPKLIEKTAIVIPPVGKTEIAKSAPVVADNTKQPAEGETKQGGPVEKAGLKNPETVTKAGAVILHPNETILPVNYNDFQTGSTPVTPKNSLPTINKDFETPEWFKKIDKLDVKSPIDEKLLKDLGVVFFDILKEISSISSEIENREAKSEKSPEDIKAIKDLKNSLIKAQKKSDSITTTYSKKDLNKMQEFTKGSKKVPFSIRDEYPSTVTLEKESLKKSDQLSTVILEKEPIKKYDPTPIRDLTKDLIGKVQPVPAAKEQKPLDFSVLKAIRNYDPKKAYMESTPSKASEGPVSSKSKMPMKDVGVQIKDMVSQIGMVIPKETIMPPSFDDFKTKPMMMAPEKGAETKATPAPVEFNITVHANEKDLAQRIANEVRGVLYKEQVNNRG